MPITRRRPTQDGFSDELLPGGGGPPGPPQQPFNPKPVFPGAPPRDDAGRAQTPREREIERRPVPPPGGGAQQAPPRPKVPTPQAGAVAPIGPPPAPMVGPPMPGPGAGSMAEPLQTPYFGGGGAQRRLFGQMRGLQGGGLGVPLDPSADEESDPITSLIRLLTARG